MELSKVRAVQLSRHSSGPSKLEEIKMELAKLAILRSTKIEEMEYELFSAQLAIYEMTYIRKALNGLSLKPRAEGETAFPDIGTMLEAVRAAVRADKPTYEQQETQKWNAYVERFKAEGNVEPDAEVLAQVAALNEKFGLKKPKVIETTYVQMRCPHCDNELAVASNIRFWTSDDLRTHADTLDKLHAMAMQNAEKES